MPVYNHASYHFLLHLQYSIAKHIRRAELRSDQTIVQPCVMGELFRVWGKAIIWRCMVVADLLKVKFVLLLNNMAFID